MERMESRACNNDQVTVIPVAPITDVLHRLKNPAPGAWSDQFHLSLKALEQAIEVIEGDVDCDFAGKVEVIYDSSSETRTWTCPRCGYEHSEDISDLIAEMRMHPDARAAL